MARKDGKQGQRPHQTIIETYRITNESDPRIGWILLGLFPAPSRSSSSRPYCCRWAPRPRASDPAGVSVALLVTSFVFGKRAEGRLAQIAGRAGAAAVLNSLRSGWFTTPAVAVTKNEDLVHRVVGRPGVILVGEGSPPGEGLLANDAEDRALGSGFRSPRSSSEMARGPNERTVMKGPGCRDPRRSRSSPP